MDKVGHNGVPDRLARASTQTTSGCGMWILLLSLSVLFFASILAYLVSYKFGSFPQAQRIPQLPAGLWLSTVLLLASSGTLHWALTVARRDRQPQVRSALTFTLGLGIAFLIVQVLNWAQLHAAMPLTRDPATGMLAGDFYLVSFYFLTVLHAAHVLGGVGPLVAVTLAGYRGVYTRTSHNGLRLLSMYWHFLDIVWLVLLVVLLATH